MRALSKVNLAPFQTLLFCANVGELYHCMDFCTELIILISKLIDGYFGSFVKLEFCVLTDAAYADKLFLAVMAAVGGKLHLEVEQTISQKKAPEFRSYLGRQSQDRGVAGVS